MPNNAHDKVEAEIVEITDAGSGQEAVVPAAETAVDENKIYDDAAAFIRGRLNSAARSMIDIGQYLLDTFFGSDPERVKQHYSARRGPSLRKLAQRPDLDVSYASLSNAVNLAVQEQRVFRQLPGAYHISETHKLLLLQVENDDDKLRYAKMVQEQRLPTRALREQLIADGVTGHRGRPLAASAPAELHGFLIEDLLKPMAPLAAISPAELSTDGWSPEQTKAALEMMVKARDNLVAMIERLQQAAG